MRRYWHCKCGTRNERVGGRKSCASCGRAAPKMKVPAHMKALEMSFEQYAELNQELHGVDGETCAICGEPGRSDIRLQRDHSHYGGYPRGLTHAACNGRLGQLEGGRWARGEQFDLAAWLRLVADYIERCRAHHEGQQAA